MQGTQKVQRMQGRWSTGGQDTAQDARKSSKKQVEAIQAEPPAPGAFPEGSAEPSGQALGIRANTKCRCREATYAGSGAHSCA